MSQQLDHIWSKLWNQYVHLNPHVDQIRKSIETTSGQPIINDHVAFRTFNYPGIGIDDLAKPFLKLGYVSAGEYHFEQKKLFARHYEVPGQPDQPKIFISELLLEKCSDELQNWVKGFIEQTPKDLLKRPDLYCAGRVWPAPAYKDYEIFYKESEYAAWLSAFGFCANHFTVFINPLNSFDSIEDINNHLESQGFKLNASGGKIKGTPEDFLEQSSTMAHTLEVEFAQGERHKVPTVYYEFAKRYPLPGQQDLYQGFVAKSADKIFESTNQ